MKIVTEKYNDNNQLEFRKEEIFCDKCGFLVNSYNDLFTVVKYVIVKNPNIDQFDLEYCRIGTDTFKCCLKCLTNFNLKQ